MSSAACETACVTVGAYLATLWIGMGFMQNYIRQGVQNGRYVTKYNPYKEEPRVVDERKRVAILSVGFAAFALGVYAYVGKRESWLLFSAISCIIFFGGSYAAYSAYPNKPRFMKRLMVIDRGSAEPFDGPAWASTVVHITAMVCALIAFAVFTIFFVQH